MQTIRRIATLLVVSIVGIALLAPLGARSAIGTPPSLEDRLLDAEPAGRAGALPRTLLTTRELVGAAPAVTGAAEVVEDQAEPQRGSVSMTAALVPVPVAAPKPVVAAAPAAAPAPPPSAPSGDGVWDALAQCESGGNWSINTGNGYYGGLQFSYGTWHDYGGGEFAEYPHQATREQQIVVAERLRADRGYAPWPACRAKLGLP
ncbi:MAG TPA: transglycosylase family protein [Candidatus Limnocylindria bacterium]|nr:transglycosylase family protein [Candidatus Limnocylindria bacterium]